MIEVQDGAVISRDKNSNEKQAVTPVVYRDPNDIWMILKLSSSTLWLVVLLSASLIFNAFQYWRKPDRIVVVKSQDGSERVVVLNDRSYGESDGVRIAKEEVGAGDKLYLGKTFTSLYYGINPLRRGDDMKQLFALLHPQFAARLSKALEDGRVPQTEREESWQSTWTIKSAEVDARDPYLVRIVGQQELTRVLAGSVKREAKIIQVEMKLAVDKRGRDDVNLRTGLMLIGVSEKLISATPIN